MQAGLLHRVDLLDTARGSRHRKEEQLGLFGRGAQPRRITPNITKQAYSTATMETVQQQRGTTLPTKQAMGAALPEGVVPDRIDETELEIKGNIPKWVQGILLKNGPGTFAGMRHLFDGYGMLFKFRFQDGRVYESNRFVQSNSYKAFQQSGGQMKFSEFGTPVPLRRALWNIIKQLTGMDQGFTDNSNVNVLPLPGARKALSLTESVDGTYEVDMETLATLGKVHYKDDVKGTLTTAHPTVLPNGDVINITTDFGGKYTIYKMQLGSYQRTKIADVPISYPPAPAWNHDFPVTEHYAIIPETPVAINVKAIALGGSAPYVVMDWKPQQGTKLHVVPLDGGPVRTFTAPNYFTFHYVNAFESADGSCINLDFGWYEDPDQLNNLLLAEMRQSTKPICAAPLRRLMIPLKGSSEVQVISLMKDDSQYVQCELPRVNPNFVARPYRYAYSICAEQPCTFSNALAKYDVQTGHLTKWFEPGTIPSEPLMVPRPGAEAEDDGVVLCVFTGPDSNSFLLVLDAQSFTELGRAQMPFGVPYQFHGNYLQT